MGAAAASQPANFVVAAPAAPAVAAVWRLGQVPAVLQHLPGALLLSLPATAGYGAGTAAGWLQGGLHCWAAQGRCAGRVCAGLGAGADLLLQLGPQKASTCKQRHVSCKQHHMACKQHYCYCYCYCYMVPDFPEHPVGSQRGSWGIRVITSRKQVTREFFAGCCMTELKLVV